MLIQTSLQISPLNSKGSGWDEGSVPPGFSVQAGLCHKVRSEVLSLSTWFCHKCSSGSLSGVDPTRPGKKLEFRGLIGTEPSLAADRRRNKRTRSAKAFRTQAEVSPALQDGRHGMRCWEEGQPPPPAPPPPKDLHQQPPPPDPPRPPT